MKGLSRIVTMICASAATAVGGAMGADATFAKDFQEQVVNTMVTHDFAENAGEDYTITSGRVVKPGAWGWNGSGAKYAGTVAFEEDASASHLGTFTGKMVANGGNEENGGEGHELTWDGKITGKATEIKFVIDRLEGNDRYRIQGEMYYYCSAKCNADALITLKLVYLNEVQMTANNGGKSAKDCECKLLIRSKSGKPLYYFPHNWEAKGTAKIGNIEKEATNKTMITNHNLLW